MTNFNFKKYPVRIIYQCFLELNVVFWINIQVDGVDDKQEFKECMEAMTTMGMDGDEQSDVVQIVTGDV